MYVCIYRQYVCMYRQLAPLSENAKSQRESGPKTTHLGESGSAPTFRTWGTLNHRSLAQRNRRSHFTLGVNLKSAWYSYQCINVPCIFRPQWYKTLKLQTRTWYQVPGRVVIWLVQWRLSGCKKKTKSDPPTRLEEMKKQDERDMG